jgi:hypothetical protein
VSFGLFLLLLGAKLFETVPSTLGAIPKAIGDGLRVPNRHCFAVSQRPIVSMYQHDKIQPLSAYLSQAGFDVPYLAQTLAEYIAENEAILKIEPNHYDHTIDYIDARGFLNEIEAFKKHFDGLNDRTSTASSTSATVAAVATEH